MVSPPYKGGYGVFHLLATAMTGEREGEGVVFDSVGNFASQPEGALASPYIARREGVGWSTAPLLAPPSLVVANGINDISPALLGLYLEELGSNAQTATSEGSGSFLFHDLYANEANSFYNWFTEPPFGVQLERLDHKPYFLLGSLGSDEHFCHIVFGEASGGALLPEARSTPSQIYEMTTGAPGCGPDRTLRLVGVSDKISSVTHEPELIDHLCPPEIGYGGDRFNAVAANGTEIFFSTELQAGCESATNPAVLFVRLNGERTLEISVPASDCTAGLCKIRQSARFVGANEAGTRVFFTTSQPLVSGDVDEANDLYMAQIGCPTSEPTCEPSKRELVSLTQISHDANSGQGANVQGVAVLSEDGRHVYFVAQGALTGANREGRSPAAGADNLYAYDSEDQTTSFVADLCSGPVESGEAVDRQCPSDLSAVEREAKRPADVGQWTVGQKELQTTGSGRFLVFTSYARLLAGDTDDAKDVYLYDAQDQTLNRISVGQEGYDANGNHEHVDAMLPKLMQLNLTQNHELNYRAISEDGSRILFETADPLAPSASNGLINAYEWHNERDGKQAEVALISVGDDEESVGAFDGVPGEIMMTPSGRDIFFMTVKGLVPQDTDGAKDVYDARLGSGFSAQAESSVSCQPDSCHGLLVRPVPLLVPGSVTQTPGENLSSAGIPHKKKISGRKRAHRQPRHIHKRVAAHARGRGRRRGHRRTTR